MKNIRKAIDRDSIIPRCLILATHSTSIPSLILSVPALSCFLTSLNVLLYAKKVSEIQICSDESEVEGSLSYLKDKEKELLYLLIKKYRREFTPIELSRDLQVTNRTIINRLSILSKNGFVIPKMVNQRIRSYELSDFAKAHIKMLENNLRQEHSK